MSDLLEKLTDDKLDSNLPAVPSRDDLTEPVEPSERQDVFEHGREPSEVIEARERKLPAAEQETYEVAGRRYTAKELEQSGLLDQMARAHSQYQQLQQQYAQLAERQRAEAPAAPAPAITNTAISQTYDPVSEVIERDLIENALAEEDFFEAYPRLSKTLIGQARFAFDLIFQLQSEVMLILVFWSARFSSYFLEPRWRLLIVPMRSPLC